MLLKNLVILFFTTGLFFDPGSNMDDGLIKRETSVLDSLKSQLDHVPDSTKVDLLNELAYRSYYIQPQFTFQYARQAVELAEQTGYAKGLSEAQRMMGIALLQRNKFRESMERLYKGLEAARSVGYNQGIADNYNSIGVIYTIIKDWRQAIRFFRKSVDYQERAGNPLRKAIVISNIGDAYLVLGRPDSARFFIDRAYRILENVDDRTWIPMILVRRAKVQTVEGDTAMAVSTLKKAILLAKKTSQNIHLRNALHELVKLYYEQHAFEKAEKLNQEEIKIAEFLGFIPFMTEAYELRYKIQMARNEIRPALNSLIIYSQYKDSLSAQQDKYNMDYLRYKYELEQKQKDFILLKKEKEAQEMAVRAKMQRQRILFIAISSFLFLVLFFSYVIYRSRKKEIETNKKLKEKNKELARQKKELGASLKMVKDLNAQLQAYNDTMNHLAIVQVIDTHGRILFVNDNFCRTTGYEKEEVTGKNSILLQSRHHNHKFYRDIFNTLKGGRTWRGEICMVDKEGRSFWVDAAIAPVLDDSGKPVQFFSLQFEITPRKNYEKQLELQKKELMELNRFKDKVFSIVSHDFRSPLNSLKGTLALYLKGMISHEEMNSLASGLLEKLNTTSYMLDNLLNWAKNQLQGIHTNPKETDVYKLVKENIDLVRPQADKKGIELKGEYSRPVWAYADEEMIKLVLRNLISNAVKFSFKGGEVRVTISEEQDRIITAVHDRGIGMNVKQMKNLFNPSAETMPGTSNEKGMGLGLLLCKEFVENNGGKIWVESKEGEGSSFYFSLKKFKQNRG